MIASDLKLLLSELQGIMNNVARLLQMKHSI